MKPYRADWRSNSPDLYPPLECSDWHRLAWEFVRRHEDYALHAKQMLLLMDSGEFSTRIKRTSDSLLDGVDCWPEANPGESAKAYFARMKETKNKRPHIDIARNTFLNRWSLERPVNPDVLFHSGEVQFVMPQVMIKRPAELKTQKFSLFLHPNEVAVRFRLDLPVAEQLAMAKTRLEAEARKFDTQVFESSEEIKRLLAASRKSRLKPLILKDVHYWLRCYDADREPKQLVKTDKNRRQLQTSGPANQCEVFNKELRAEGNNNFYNNDNVDGFLARAKAHIEGKKFLLLLRPHC